MERRLFFKNAGVLGGGGLLTLAVTQACSETTDSKPARPEDPRLEIMTLVGEGQLEQLMVKAAQLHGHYCPGLAMGIVGTVYAMQKLLSDSDIPFRGGGYNAVSVTGRQLIADVRLNAIVETSNCVVDGVQFVTGCAVGNKSLIYRDTGKVAFTLLNSEGKGVRLCALHNSGEVIKTLAGDDRAFGTLKIPVDQLFTISEVQLTLPKYENAEEIVCSVCGEGVKSTHLVTVNDQQLCYDCAKNNSMILDGYGIHEKIFEES